MPIAHARDAGPALFLFAHHDDELFAATALARERRSGVRVVVAFTTYGSRYGTPVANRTAESAAALSDLGVSPSDVHQVGLDSATFDFALAANLPACYRRAAEVLRDLPLARVYVPAWEGGHPDHDATHLLGVRLALDRPPAEVLAYPTYRAALCPLPLWRTLAPLPGAGALRSQRLTLREGWRALRLARHFPSQWKSLLGLLPGACWRLLVLRRERLVTVAAMDYRTAPHPGRLFYTRRWGLTFEEFRAAAAPFLDGWDAPGRG